MLTASRKSPKSAPVFSDVIPDADLDRNAAIARIRTALRLRSGKAWSVTGGRGTAYGWITIRARGGDSMDPATRVELAALLGLSLVHPNGVLVMASYDGRREFIDRAEGRTPRKIAEPYWD